MLGIDISKQYMGLDEVKDNKKIKDLLKSKAQHNDIQIDPATTSWCAAWVNFCERSVGNHGNGSLLANSFKTYGKEVKRGDEQEGDIVVFHFPSHLVWQGHVAYISEIKNGIARCLGGNQDNKVKYSDYAAKHIVAIRRP